MLQIELEFEIVVFLGDEKLDKLEKNLSGQRREPRTSSTHIMINVALTSGFEPSHIAGRRMLSPLRHQRAPDRVVNRFRV